jgi:hypothetical protein
VKSYLEILNEMRREGEKYFRNYTKYAKMAKKVAERELQDVRVFVFGSVVKGQATPASDIDLLIVSKSTPPSMKERAKIKAKILTKIGIFAPFEIHIVDEKEFRWYERFIDKKVEI